MYIGVFIITTALLGSTESFDPNGPLPTLEQCEKRLVEATPRMTKYLMQFGLQELSAECRVDNSQAI